LQGWYSLGVFNLILFELICDLDLTAWEQVYRLLVHDIGGVGYMARL